MFLFDVGEEGGVAEIGLAAGADEGAILAFIHIFGWAFCHKINYMENDYLLIINLENNNYYYKAPFSSPFSPGPTFSLRFD